MNNQLLKTLYLAGALLLSGAGGLQAGEATTVEAPEKIYIQADHMLLNLETGNSVYTGNVRVSQGELLLTGDRVTVEQGDDAVERITVTGRPAHYNHVTGKGDTIRASSEHMVYTASRHQLVMTVNAKLQQPDHVVSSEKIIYDTEKKLVIAGAGNGSSADDRQRVKIILTPKKEPGKQQEKP